MFGLNNLHNMSAALVFIDKKQMITADPLKDQLSRPFLACLPLITNNMTALTVKLFYFPQILHLSDEVLCDIFVIRRKHFRYGTSKHQSENEYISYRI